MERQTVFIKVKINESHIGLKDVFVIDVDGGRKWGDLERGFHNTIAVRFNGGVQLMTAKYLLEEIELPSVEDVCEGVRPEYEKWKEKGFIETLHQAVVYKYGLVDTLYFILNKLKGETK